MTGSGPLKLSTTSSLRILLGRQDGVPDLGAVEMAFAPGDAGPPLHVHPTHAEAFYVLVGELTLQVGADVLTGGPGTWACAPRDVPHTLANLGGTEGRVLCLFAPGGFERRFERMLAHDAEELRELAAAERLTRLVGPPLSSPTFPAPRHDHPR